MVSIDNVPLFIRCTFLLGNKQHIIGKGVVVVFYDVGSALLFFWPVMDAVPLPLYLQKMSEIPATRKKQGKKRQPFLHIVFK